MRRSWRTLLPLHQTPLFAYEKFLFLRAPRLTSRPTAFPKGPCILANRPPSTHASDAIFCVCLSPFGGRYGTRDQIHLRVLRCMRQTDRHLSGESAWRKLALGAGSNSRLRVVASQATAQAQKAYSQTPSEQTASLETSRQRSGKSSWGIGFASAASFLGAGSG